ncbi:hypothetical protein [Aquimarina sp. 2201CG5-10]|uniref:hypothetical protein n=1 Tax=Aquimarina callyspongiae TaxID=3098150 RepID=UPI002AB4B6EF|nr:hypothetical protein [Aquimarina sp. 2201CG5-10]MDY8137457.1 hypothetical protein [Aquimarina sp. 2201CG5-10]
MKLIQESAFISEIIFQADLVSYANDRLKKSVDAFENIGVWSAIQSILISSSNISKILWPKRKYEERGQELRDLMKIDSECVLKSRKFRNKFEHYDDFISDFFEDKVIHSYCDFVMNPSLQSFGIESCHRGYNSYNNTLLIQGEILDLNSIIDTVKEIRLKCKNLFLQ